MYAKKGDQPIQGQKNHFEFFASFDQLIVAIAGPLLP